MAAANRRIRGSASIRGASPTGTCGIPSMSYSGQRDPLTARCDRTALSSIMLEIKVDRNDAATLHDQVAAAIRRAIAQGEAGPGDRLPMAKDLAAVLGVNTNTVLRALRLLRDEGLLDFQRGRGITVTGTTERNLVLDRIRELMEFCRLHGYRREEVVQLIEGLP